MIHDSTNKLKGTVQMPKHFIIFEMLNSACDKIFAIKIFHRYCEIGHYDRFLAKKRVIYTNTCFGMMKIYE